jgi:hypothetical protein
MKKLLSFALLGAGIAAVVASPDAARADIVSLQSLPAVPAQPATAPTAPAKIAATSHTDGFFPAILPAAKRKTAEEAGYRYVQVFATEKEAKEYASAGTLTSTTPADLETTSATRTCMTTGGTLSPHLSLYYRTKPYKPSAQTIALLKKLKRWPPPPVKPSKEPPKDAVYLVRVEHLTRAGDTATIETSEAFIDLQTMGTQFVSTSSEKLSRVATGPNDLAVYAARDDKGGTQLLVTNPELPAPPLDEDRLAQVQRLTATADRLVGQTPTGSSFETGCGYLKFTLAAKPGAGEMATVLATAFLPATEVNPDDPAFVEESKLETPGMSDEQRKSIRETVHRENRMQRARTMAVNMSFSQLESEPAPVLSVTFGWASKDQELRF